MTAPGATVTTTATATPPPPLPPAAPPTGSTLDIFGFQLDWMVVALIVALAGTAYALYRAQLNQQNQIDVLDLLSENGRLSRSACVLMGAFAVTTWMLIQLTLNGKLTEGYFLAYSAAWIVPAVTKLVINGTAGAPVDPKPKG